MQYAAIDRPVGTAARTPKDMPRYSPRRTLAILAAGSIASWAVIILGLRAII